LWPCLGSVLTKEWIVWGQSHCSSHMICDVVDVKLCMQNEIDPEDRSDEDSLAFPVILDLDLGARVEAHPGLYLPRQSGPDWRSICRSLCHTPRTEVRPGAFNWPFCVHAFSWRVDAQNYRLLTHFAYQNGNRIAKSPPIAKIWLPPSAELSDLCSIRDLSCAIPASSLSNLKLNYSPTTCAVWSSRIIVVFRDPNELY
jgi:hypothetical protein